jgi:hypothetical protein
MIRFLVFVACACSTVGFAKGAELAGFLELPWGAGVAEAKKQIPERSRARLDRQKSNETHLRFEGGKFASFKANQFDLSFADDSFYRAEVRLEPLSKDHAKEFAALKKLLTEKYGPPGRDETGRLESTWYFPVPGKPADLINVHADPKGPGLHLFYLSEGTKAAAKKVAADPAPTPKPAKTSADAKDDL